MELGTKCAKICQRENVVEGLMRENLAARKYVRSQYMHFPIIPIGLEALCIIRVHWHACLYWDKQFVDVI